MKVTRERCERADVQSRPPAWPNSTQHSHSLSRLRAGTLQHLICLCYVLSLISSHLFHISETGALCFSGHLISPELGHLRP